MSVSVSTTNKPLNPRAQDLSPKGYNRAALYSGKALDFDGVNDYVTLKGYVNGVSIGSIAASFDFSTASGLLNLFKHSAAAQYAEGAMAGFKIFNTALTAAQVADLYLNPEKIVPDGVASSALKLWLPMMEGAGTTAYDGSGNGNHGTINGATWVSGIGAPVAQTALVSWNKGTNELALYSEQFDNAAWTKTGVGVTANNSTSPDGNTQNADTQPPKPPQSSSLKG
jgi:hypothetical protein